MAASSLIFIAVIVALLCTLSVTVDAAPQGRLETAELSGQPSMVVECQSLQLRFQASASMEIRLERIASNDNDYSNVITQQVAQGEVRAEFPVAGRYTVSIVENGQVLWSDTANVAACQRPAKNASSQRKTILIVILVGTLVGVSLVVLSILNYVYKERAKRLQSMSKSLSSAVWDKHLGVYKINSYSSTTLSRNSSSAININNNNSSSNNNYHNSSVSSISSISSVSSISSISSVSSVSSKKELIVKDKDSV